MGIKIVMGTMASGMGPMAVVESQRSMTGLNDPRWSCAPGLAKKIGEAILENCKCTLIMHPRALSDRQK